MSRRVFLATALIVLASAFVPAFAADGPVATPITEGTDYIVISDGKPFATPVKGKVEVVEVFGYTCPHCAHFQPELSAWLRTRAKQVNFVPLAAPFGGYWQPYAKAFYAAQTLGVAEKSHDAMFLALHTDGSLPLHDPSVGELGTFYARYGVDPAKFAATYEGDDATARMRKAAEFIQRSDVDGTPTLVVAGKYKVLGRGFKDMLRIADALIVRERAGKTR
ncbi:thiol:disulfide interchange protein DsbA/DsbL [Lysobacter sp. LF1]|uniref:Thiol:disulfide interchange protein DsbA/DsbL n=1 Tax=Lysobacter stagni TaxID=3045172 RepID=A0ABT6XCH2_9GAMM|nr:thiol:disulfide interchange protein DsbA/DsbL [Lysobacter sp. LF1]MDI9237832.1 thiol:disulfide interchange protein DsbA/DsbL [Lysobacter sp. LF1]